MGVTLEPIGWRSSRGLLSRSPTFSFSLSPPTSQPISFRYQSRLPCSTYFSFLPCLSSHATSDSFLSPFLSLLSLFFYLFSLFPSSLSFSLLFLFFSPLSSIRISSPSLSRSLDLRTSFSLFLFPLTYSPSSTGTPTRRRREAKMAVG